MSCFIEEFRLVSDMKGRLVAGQLTLEYSAWFSLVVAISSGQIRPASLIAKEYEWTGPGAMD